MFQLMKLYVLQGKEKYCMYLAESVSSIVTVLDTLEAFSVTLPTSHQTSTNVTKTQLEKSNEPSSTVQNSENSCAFINSLSCYVNPNMEVSATMMQAKVPVVMSKYYIHKCSNSLSHFTAPAELEIADSSYKDIQKEYNTGNTAISTINGSTYNDLDSGHNECNCSGQSEHNVFDHDEDCVGLFLLEAVTTDNSNNERETLSNGYRNSNHCTSKSLPLIKRDELHHECDDGCDAEKIGRAERNLTLSDIDNPSREFLNDSNDSQFAFENSSEDIPLPSSIETLSQGCICNKLDVLNQSCGCSGSNATIFESHANHRTKDIKSNTENAAGESTDQPSNITCLSDTYFEYSTSDCVDITVIQEHYDLKGGNGYIDSTKYGNTDFIDALNRTK